MGQTNDFRDLFIQDELDKLVVKAEEELKRNYVHEENKGDIWENNILDITEVSDFLFFLDKELSYNFTVHYTATDNEQSYEDMGSRIVVFSGLKVIHTMWFQDLIGYNEWKYEGIQKEGFIKIVKSMLLYKEFGKVSAE